MWWRCPALPGAVASCGATMTQPLVHRHKTVMHHRRREARLASTEGKARVNSLTLVDHDTSQPFKDHLKSVDSQIVELSEDSKTQDVILHPSTRPAARVGHTAAATHQQTRPWLQQKTRLAALVVMALAGSLVSPAGANTPPRFILDGQSEIVIRLTEGEATPVGK